MRAVSNKCHNGGGKLVGVVIINDDTKCCQLFSREIKIHVRILIYDYTRTLSTGQMPDLIYAVIAVYTIYTAVVVYYDSAFEFIYYIGIYLPIIILYTVNCR